jgi:hypothetical protein
LDQKLQFTYP